MCVNRGGTAIQPGTSGLLRLWHVEGCNIMESVSVYDQYLRSKMRHAR
jgi:hypothetical protein